MKKVQNKIKEFLANKENILFLILFLLLLVICYFFPYTHDDWAWGTQIGIDRLNSLFKDYNGRWLGNIFVIALTRSRIIRALIIALTLTGIIYLINKIISGNKNIKYITIILMLLLPINILAQAVAWTSGFTNYVIPTLISIYYILINKNIFENKKVEINKKLYIPLLLMGFANSLFVEHMTIYNLIVSIFLTIFISKKEKKLSLGNLLYMFGSIIGTVLMFSNGAYHNIQNATDTYRTIGTSNIFENAFKTYFNELYKLFIHQNTIINIILCVSMLILSYKSNKKIQKMNKFKKITICSCLTIIIGYLCYILYTKINGGTNIFIYNLYKKVLEGSMVIVYLMSLLIITCLIIDKKENKARILFEMFSAVIIAAPLLIVTPIGARCFFPTYVMLVIICCELINIIISKSKIDIRNFLSGISIFLIICSFSIYGYSHMIEQERINYINKNSNETKLVLPNITHTGYMQSPNPKSEVFKERFKLFYGINKDAQIEFVTYVEWKKLVQK